MTSPTGYMSIADGQCPLLITVIQAPKIMEQLSALMLIHNVGRIDCSEGLVATTKRSILESDTSLLLSACCPKLVI